MSFLLLKRECSKVVLHGIILTVQAFLMPLDNLEARLSVLGDIAVREGLVVTKARDELLAELWTFFGANRAELAHFSRTLEVLQQLGSYKQSSMKYILATIEVMEALQVDAEQTHIVTLPPAEICSLPPNRRHSLWRSLEWPQIVSERTSVVRGQISNAHVTDREMSRSVT